MNWMTDAACTTTDPELFFPSEKEGWATAGMAKAICDVCPVAAECLRYALDNEISEGIWAGTTPKEREARRAGREAA